MSTLFRKVTLPASLPGSLLLHSMPGRYEDWLLFLNHLQKEQVGYIACLTSLQEIERKSPNYANAIRQRKLTCDRSDFPIEDFGIPENVQEYQTYVKSIADKLLEGTNVLLHCAGGIGRTGMTANCILHRLGFVEEKAWQLIQNAGSSPETPPQRHLVHQHAQQVLQPSQGEHPQ